MEPYLGVAAIVATYAVIAAALLSVAGWLAKKNRAPGKRFPITLHLLAALGALVGGLLAWMAFASDHPSKWKELTLPFVMAALVYGYAIYADPEYRASIVQRVRKRLGR